MRTVYTRDLKYLRINILRSRPLRRTCSACPSTSQPFSARHWRRGNYLLGNPPEVICFLYFWWRSFFVFFPFFRGFVVSSFSSYEHEYEHYWCTFLAFLFVSTNTKFFVFELAFLLLGTAQAKLRKPQQQCLLYVPQAQQNSLQSALHRAAKNIPVTVVRSCRPECDNASK